MPLPRALSTSATQLSREIRFIFTGTIERVGSTSLSLLPGEGRTTVVRIDRIHRATSALRDQVGQQVTVTASADRALGAEREQRVFFTDPILYGETIAVRALAQFEVPEDAEALHDLIERAGREQRDEAMREHEAAADHVILGQVLAVKRAAIHDPSRVSEHSPDWWVATVRVVRSYKGDLKGEVRVRYPNSHDVRWYGVPKLEEGHEAILVLHRDGRDIGDAVFAILDQHDVRPPDADDTRRTRHPRQR